MKNLYQFNAFIEEDGQKKPFVLVISDARKSDDADDYFCTVHAPALFKRDKNIHGVDSDQACELAMNFVRSLIEGKRLIDSTGNPVVI